MREPKAKGVFLGVDFQVDDYWKFHVPTLEKTWDTYEKMKAGIEEAQKAIVASNREKLSLPVICEISGKEVVITGIHAGHGGLTTQPKTDRFSDGRYFLPRESWIVAGLDEAIKLRERADKIACIVHGFAITGPSRFQVALHAEHVAELRKDFKEKTAAAKKTDLEKELAKPERKVKF